MHAPLKIVFLGSDPIALTLLGWLVPSAGSGQATSTGSGLAASTSSGQAGEGGAHAQIVGVFTQPDRAVGRGQKVQPNAIKLWAKARGLPVFQPEKITAEARADLAALNADVALVMAYGHILPDDFIATPRLGTLNLHTSLLPKYRGASPIQTAVASGERETGVTLMRVIRQLDAGPLAAAERVAIAPHDTALEVEQKLSAACVPLLARALPAFAADTLVFTEQAHAAATFCRKLRKEDGVLDFTAPAAVIAARINGLFPWPTCAVEIAGQPVKFGLAEIVAQVADLGSASPETKATQVNAPGDNLAAAPGTVIGSDAEGLLIATGAGVLRVLRLQRAGGRMLAAGEFLRGFPVPSGTVLPSQPMPGLVASAPFRR